jgi:hypothetical protein
MNRTSKWLIASALLLTVALSNLALAYGSMRCGSHIISAGERHGPGKYEVLKKCGEPVTWKGNSWVYELPGGATRTVVFDWSGNLVRIE